ncbi:MAG: FAD binding domain-containing protein [bacterium]|nr:FAD binding domain-containing protein [bacterium]
MANPTFYTRPTDLETVKTLLREHPHALAISGGGLTFSGVLLPYERVIDVQAVPELQRIERLDGGVSIGAGVMLGRLLEIPELPDVFRRALTRCLPLNVRNNVSVMESFQQRQHPLLREWHAALMAYDVLIDLFDPATGDCLRANLLHLAARKRLESGLVLCVGLPFIQPAPFREAMGAAVVARTPAGEPLVNAAVYVALQDGLVASVDAAVGGASAEPVTAVQLGQVLTNNPLNAANIASAVKLVPLQLQPVGDYKASAEYRREMARLCVGRALMECLEGVG